MTKPNVAGEAFLSFAQIEQSLNEITQPFSTDTHNV